MACSVYYYLCKDVQRVHVHTFAQYRSPVYHYSAYRIILEDNIFYGIAVEYGGSGMYGMIKQCRGTLYRVHHI